MKIETKSLLEIGEVFAERYEIIKFLGKGGQGEVYKVLDLQSNTKEVLKILTDIESQSSFKKEIAALKSLNNEGIVRIYDGDISSEKPYYTMEYLEGLPLHILIANYSLSYEEIETIIVKLLQALKYLHETGKKLHRDIKPSNVFVVFREKEGTECLSEIEISRVVLIDFGTIRNINVAEETLTKDSSFVRGTYRYMAPEQIDGKECSPATDIYAVGEILYEMVFKKPLFDSETLTGLISQKRSPANFLDGLNTKNPKKSKAAKSNFKKFILKATEPDPKNRFQNAEEALKFLEKPPLFYFSGKAKKEIAAVFIFVLLFFSISFIYINIKHSALESINKKDNQILALDAKNNVLWKKAFPAEITSCEVLKNPTPKIEREVVVTTGLGDNPQKTGGIYLIKENGETIWEYEMGKREWVEGCGNLFISHLASVVDVDKDGEKELIFTSYNFPWYPTLILVLRPSGEVYGNLWSCGAIQNLTPFEYQGKTHFVTIASNNKLRTQTLFWFDASKPFLYNTFGWTAMQNPFLIRRVHDPSVPLPTTSSQTLENVFYPNTSIFMPTWNSKENLLVKYNDTTPCFCVKNKDGKEVELGLNGYPLNEEYSSKDLSLTNAFLYKIDNSFVNFLDNDEETAFKNLSLLENELPDIPILKSWYYKFSGLKFKEKGNLEEAQQRFVKALQFFPEDKTPYVYLSEIYMIKNEIEEAEKCIDNFKSDSAKYLTEYGNAYIFYPIYLALLKEDYVKAEKLFRGDISKEREALSAYDCNLNYTISLFMGRKPFDEFLLYNDIVAQDPSYWFWRIANETLIQNNALDLSVKRVRRDVLEKEDIGVFLLDLSNGKISEETLLQIKKKSNFDIEYKLYYPVCCLLCARHFQQKGDLPAAKKYAKEILNSKGIGYLKQSAQKILKS